MPSGGFRWVYNLQYVLQSHQSDLVSIRQYTGKAGRERQANYFLCVTPRRYEGRSPRTEVCCRFYKNSTQIADIHRLFCYPILLMPSRLGAFNSTELREIPHKRVIERTIWQRASDTPRVSRSVLSSRCTGSHYDCYRFAPAHLSACLSRPLAHDAVGLHHKLLAFLRKAPSFGWSSMERPQPFPHHAVALTRIEGLRIWVIACYGCEEGLKDVMLPPL